MNEKEVPMIPKHQAESMMMHMSWAIRDITIVALAFAVAFVVAILIFVNGYTSRTKDWLNTYAQLQRTEVANEKEETGDVLESPVP